MGSLRDFNIDISPTFAPTGLEEFYSGAEGYASTHEEAMQQVQQRAMEQSLALKNLAFQQHKDYMTQQLDRYRGAVKEGKQLAAQELGNLVTKPGVAFNEDMQIGWTENYLTQLTPGARETADTAFSHLSELKDTLSLGGIKDLSSMLAQ